MFADLYTYSMLRDKITVIIVMCIVCKVRLVKRSRRASYHHWQKPWHDVLKTGKHRSIVHSMRLYNSILSYNQPAMKTPYKLRRYMCVCYCILQFCNEISMEETVEILGINFCEVSSRSLCPQKVEQLFMKMKRKATDISSSSSSCSCHEKSTV